MQNSSPNSRFLIEANGRDGFGTSFQFFDGAETPRSAAQAVSDMFRRTPGEAVISVYELDFKTGEFHDVSTAILIAAEKAFHAGVEYDNARATKQRVRRGVSSYGTATAPAAYPSSASRFGGK